jgi:hypothetical protein
LAASGVGHDVAIVHEGERPYGFSAQGSFGQALAVLPRERLVVVRMVDVVRGDPSEDLDSDELAELARALVHR